MYTQPLAAGSKPGVFIGEKCRYSLGKPAWLMAREAKADGIRDTMLFFGRQRLGEPSEAIDDALWNIDDPDKLLPIAKRIPEVASWEELLRGAP